MPDAPVVSVVIGSYNRREFLRPTIESVREELEGIDREVIVVDGGSTDGSVRWLLQQKDIVTIVQHNRGAWRGRRIERKSWGYFMNLGFRAARGRYICMLSDDCLVVPGAIRNGIATFDDALAQGSNVGAAAFYWRDWQGKPLYRVGSTFGDTVYVNHGLFLSDALAAIGYADEDRYFFYHADGDICLRLAEAGYSCVPAPNSFVEHHKHVNVRVKAGNRARAAQDWTAYTERWRHLGEPTQGWIEKPFDDPYRTAERYWHAIDRRERRRQRLRSRSGRATVAAAIVAVLLAVFGLLPEALGDWPYNPFGTDSRAHQQSPDSAAPRQLVGTRWEGGPPPPRV